MVPAGGEMPQTKYYTTAAAKGRQSTLRTTVKGAGLAFHLLVTASINQGDINHEQRVGARLHELQEN